MSSHDRPSNHSRIDRRDFLKLAGSAAIGSAALSAPLAWADAGKPVNFKINRHWSDEKIFKAVKKEFMLDKHSVYMNIGTTGSMPKQVLRNYNAYNELVAKDPWHMNGEWGSFPYTTELVARMAPQFGCDPSELIISRNTTDGMVSVLHGLDLRAGDHIVSTHHEHVGGIAPLWVLSDRNGVDVEYVDIPVFPTDPEEYVDVIIGAVRPETRLIVVSHATYKTGTVLPVARICQEAAARGIVTLVDGAHGPGMLDLDFHGIDCDFYAGSGHKWQCGPGSTGLLYVRDNGSRVAEFWPDRKPMWAVNSSLSHYVPYFGWQMVLQYKGNDNFPALRALADSCDLWAEIGRDRIESHDRGLAALARQRIRESLPTSVLYTPDLPELTGGITAFNPFADQTDLTTLNLFRDRLREEYSYIIRTTDFKVNSSDAAEVHALRISTHLFHDEDDVEGLVAAMADLFGNM